MGVPNHEKTEFYLCEVKRIISTSKPVKAMLHVAPYFTQLPLQIPVVLLTMKETTAYNSSYLLSSHMYKCFGIGRDKQDCVLKCDCTT